MIPEPCLATSKLCDTCYMDHVLQCMITVLCFFSKIYTVIKSASKSEKNQDI